MLKRPVRFVTCVVIVVCLGTAAVVLLARRSEPREKSIDPINAQSYARICVGMKEEEVEEIFGGPARTEIGLSDDVLLFPGRGVLSERIFTKTGLELRNGRKHLGWMTRGILVVIEIDKSGSVVAKDMLTVQHSSEEGEIALQGTRRITD
jgi:hypothetical protein